MRNLKLAAAAALLCSGLALSGAQASSFDAPANQCHDLAKQVKAALDDNQQSQNYQDAVRARRSGNDFCVHGLYKPGIANYQSGAEDAVGNGAGQGGLADQVRISLALGTQQEDCPFREQIGTPGVGPHGPRPGPFWPNPSSARACSMAAPQSSTRAEKSAMVHRWMFGVSYQA